MMEFKVLGTLEVWYQDASVDLGAPMLRKLLALLLCHEGRPVSPESAIDAIWEGAPPPSARKTLQVYVMRLRRALARDNLIRHGAGGYTLTVPVGSLDSQLFLRYAENARAADGAGDRVGAGVWYADALRLWRGPAFADVRAVPDVAAEARRLEEHRLALLEEKLQIDLDLKNDADMVAVLRAEIRGQPYRERLRELLMLALSAAGRRAEALEVYRETRAVLADELGMEPGPELTRLHMRILNDDPAVTPVRRDVGGPPPRFLPAAPADFAGRIDELIQLTEFAADAGTARPVVISAITGLGGVGKTALALHWAHLQTNRFPDGLFYLDMRGHTPGRPLSALEALHHVLQRLGLPPERLPHDVGEAAAVLRAYTAERRLLLLLDNVQSAEQVRPLLPADPGCLTLITSRDRLTGLQVKNGARRLLLGALPLVEAVQLLRKLIGEQRCDAELAAVQDLATFCMGMPLGLSIAAAKLADEPGMHIAAYVEQVTELGAWRALAVTGDEETALRAVLDSSLAGLPAAAQRAFALIALIPGTGVTALLCAAALGCSPEETQRVLTALSDQHLLEMRDGAHWVMHDLVRDYAYAHQPVPDNERFAAWDRLLAFVGDHAARGAKIVSGQDPAEDGDTPATAFITAEDVRTWLEDHRANLVGIVSAAMTTFPDRARAVSVELGKLFNKAGYTAEWISVAEAAIPTDHSGAAGDMIGPLLNSLGNAYLMASMHDKALRIHSEGLELRSRLGDHAGRARSHANIALIHEYQGDYESALEHYQRAVDISASCGETALWFAVMAGGLTGVHFRRGDYALTRSLLVGLL